MGVGKLEALREDEKPLVSGGLQGDECIEITDWQNDVVRNKSALQFLNWTDLLNRCFNTVGIFGITVFYIRHIFLLTVMC